MVDLLNKTINLSQTGLLYNPQLQSDETVEKLFVVRRKQFELLLNKLLQEKENSIPQHHLFIGQRGMGKTTLLKRMEVELHKKQYRQKFIPLLYREEQYNIKDLAEFWLNTLDALADSLQSEEYPTEKVADIDKTIEKLSKKSPKIISEEAHTYLMDICSDLQRRPVLLIDNIDLIFSRLDNYKENKTEQWALRKLLSENGAPIIISGGVTLTDNINNYDKPFYDFFQIQQLYKLNYDEFTELLLNLATVTNSDKTVFDSIQKNRSRQESLLKLTGGSPRLAVMLFEQIAKGFSSNINDDLEILADKITPLYKARFEELPPQQQIILDAIALNWDAIPLNRLSTVTRMQNNQLSPQLKRLVDDGWIETTPAYKSKGNAYFISERFFNIYYLIRNSSRRHKDKVYCLSKFLECFYGKEDLDKISNELLKQGIYSFEQMRLHLALSKVKTLTLSQRKKMQDKTFETFLNNEKLCKEFDFSEEYFLEKGKSNYKLKLFDDAISCFNRVIDTNKNEKCAWCLKIKSLYELTKYEDALINSDEFTKIEPNEICAWTIKGNLLLDLSRFEEAIDCFNRVIELELKDSSAWYNKGYALIELKRFEEAIDCLDRAIELEPKNSSAWNSRGYALKELKRFEEVIDCLDKVIGLEPKNSSAWYNKGCILIEQKRFEKAIDCFDRAIELEPKDSFAWYNKGCILIELKRFEEAIDCLDRAIEIEPKDFSAWYNKGYILIELKRFEEAINCLDGAIELEPKNSTAWNNKGYALIELKKYKAAVEVYKQSIEIDPDNILLKFNLLFLYRDKLGEMDMAVELFNSIDRNKTNENKTFSFRYHLHKTLFELYKKNNGLAREYLLQAFEIYENEEEISSIANKYWWIRFGSVVIKLCCGSWLLAILKEKHYDNILSPYYVAMQALEIEQQDSKKGKENAEIYLKNRAIEISDPANIIIEKMRNYM
jgi:tetratricopeptide (TPR) repeat protein